MLYYFLFAYIMSFVLSSTISTGAQHSHSHPSSRETAHIPFRRHYRIAHGITYINLVLPLSCPSSSACHFVIPRLLGNCYLLKDFPPDCGKHKERERRRGRGGKPRRHYPLLCTVRPNYTTYTRLLKLHTYCYQITVPDTIVFPHHNIIIISRGKCWRLCYTNGLRQIKCIFLLLFFQCLAMASEHLPYPIPCTVGPYSP